MKLKVYFCQRPLQRQRQRETVEFCPDAIEVLKPKNVQFTKDADIHHKQLSCYRTIRSFFLRGMVAVHFRPITDPEAEKSNLLFTWGAIPVRTKKTYVVELDTPYVLSLYSLLWFRLMRPFLRKILLGRRCAKIVCISEACLHTLRVELGQAVADKAVVVYPYIEDHRHRAKVHEKERVNFLFVSTQFYLKGGREVLHAFERLVDKHEKISLTIVSNTPKEIVDRYRDFPWIKFVNADLVKEELFRKYYQLADVFVLPSYQDSFGLVFLEAISFGLPVIATDSYAIPEMVEHGRNGFLIDPPFHYYKKNGRANRFFWNKDLSGLILSQSYPKVENQLYDYMEKLLESDLRKEMSRYSIELFRHKFIREVRDDCFVSALN